jgi:23S rRNA (pseudouridine1915-N3)-methyltransferase
MKIKLFLTGKTEGKWLHQGISDYLDRLSHYISFEVVELPGLKKMGSPGSVQIKAREGEQILKAINSGDYVVLLDEHGKEMTSLEFAGVIQKHLIGSTKTLVFVVGGAFGFDDRVKERASMTLSLSQMTFSHQMVRLFIIEQLYRAMTIIRGEQYHHE